MLPERLFYTVIPMIFFVLFVTCTIVGFIFEENVNCVFLAGLIIAFAAIYMLFFFRKIIHQEFSIEKVRQMEKRSQLDRKLLFAAIAIFIVFFAIRTFSFFWPLVVILLVALFFALLMIIKSESI